MRTRVWRLVSGFADDLGPPRNHDPSLSALLRRSVCQAALVASMCWQILMLVAVAVEPEVTVRLVAAHLVGLVAALLCVMRRLPPHVLYIVASVLFLVDWSLVSSMSAPLLLAALWMMNLATPTATVSIGGRWGWLLPFAMTFLVTAAMVPADRDDLDEVRIPAYLATQCVIIVVSRIGYSVLVRYADAADRRMEDSAAEMQAAAAVRAAAMRSSEDARILHDTLVNTLGALAAGGGATKDRAAVRERCRSDLERFQGPAQEHTDERFGSLEELGRRLGLAVDVTGISDSELETTQALLEHETAQAVWHAVRELMQNSSKHSGSGQIRLDFARTADDLLITVTDDGAGFDLTAAGGFGLQRSVRERAAAHGFGVDIHTGSGSGTRCVVRVPLTSARGLTESPDGPSADHTIEDFVSANLRLRRRAVLVWIAGMSVVHPPLALVGRPLAPNLEHLMVLVAALSCLPALVRIRRGGDVRWPEVTMLMAGAVGAFLCGAAAVDFGREDPTPWQAIGCTPPLVLLVASRRGLRWLALAIAPLIVAAVAIVRVVGPDAETGYLLSPLVVITAVAGLTAAWRGFEVTMERIGIRVAGELSVLVRDRAYTAQVKAQERVRQRLRAAVIDDVLDLLEHVRSGTVDIADADFRAECGLAESDLRRLITLDPRQVIMGGWFVRAIGLARARKVHLTLRTDGSDLDVSAADLLGTYLLNLIEVIDPDTDVTVGFYTSSGGARLRFVGAPEQLIRAGRLPAPSGASQRVVRFDEQMMIEIGVGDVDATRESARPVTEGAVTDAWL